ncbi:hypothetical protein CF160_11305 [Enterococcus pseudoavium]|nr:hypothetical protein CF160_11305 [Enterococcus pseudoavium]
MGINFNNRKEFLNSFIRSGSLSDKTPFPTISDVFKSIVLRYHFLEKNSTIINSSQKRNAKYNVDILNNVSYVIKQNNKGQMILKEEFSDKQTQEFFPYDIQDFFRILLAAEEKVRISQSYRNDSSFKKLSWEEYFDYYSTLKDQIDQTKTFFGKRRIQSSEAYKSNNYFLKLYNIIQNANYDLDHLKMNRIKLIEGILNNIEKSLLDSITSFKLSNDGFSPLLPTKSFNPDSLDETLAQFIWEGISKNFFEIYIPNFILEQFDLYEPSLPDYYDLTDMESLLTFQKRKKAKEKIRKQNLDLLINDTDKLFLAIDELKKCFKRYLVKMSVLNKFPENKELSDHSFLSKNFKEVFSSNYTTLLSSFEESPNDKNLQKEMIIAIDDLLSLEFRNIFQQHYEVQKLFILDLFPLSSRASLLQASQLKNQNKKEFILNFYHSNLLHKQLELKKLDTRKKQLEDEISKMTEVPSEEENAYSFYENINEELLSSPKLLTMIEQMTKDNSSDEGDTHLFRVFSELFN